MNQIARKLGYYAIALWAAVTLNFAIPRMLPGDPVDVLLAKLAARGPVLPETRRAYELLLGTDSSVPLWKQYFGYLGNLLRGDLGVSVSQFPTKVSTVIADAIPWTIMLVGISTIIAFVLGVGLGMLVGWKRGTWLDHLVPVTTTLQAVPYFWLALVLVYFLSARAGIFPLNGGYNYATTMPGWNREFISSALYYGALPAITIVISSVGGWLLGMRNMMVSTLSEDYIVTAQAKGLRSRRVMVTYAARNAVLPSLAGFAISLGFVVAGSIVTEQVFSYPGIGYTLLQSVQNNDYALMQGVFLVITLAVLGANLIVDLLYGFIDPRTRSRA